MNQTVKEIGKKVVSFIPTKPWLSWLFRRKMGYAMDWKSPKTFNQKLQWLKVYDRKPIYTTMVDKYEAKKYVAEIIGEEYIIPTLGVWDKFEDIDFDALPDQFVLKCTHDSGGLAIVRDKSTFDKEKARKQFKIALNRNPYDVTREWPYKNVKPRIIAEQYMVDEETKELRDYKFFCFGGEVKAMLIATERDVEGNVKMDFFDCDGNHLPFRRGHENAKKTPAIPNCYEEMVALAEKLSEGICHVRVDLYSINGKIYFGEMTFYPASGLRAFEPAEWDRTFGDWLKLPSKNN